MTSRPWRYSSATGGEQTMQSQAVHFGTLTPRSSGRRALPPSVWTGLGALAIPLWATWPTLAVWASAMPAFQILTIAFAVGWLTLTLVESRTETTGKDRDRQKSDILPVLACAFGLCGSSA